MGLEDSSIVREDLSPMEYISEKNTNIPFERENVPNEGDEVQ